jgi:bacterioferritin (cytochrome b1)
MMMVNQVTGAVGDPGQPGALGQPGLTLQLFLDYMNSDLQNEWTHLQFYLYHASAAQGLHAHEYKEFLTEAAAGEMKHVQAFLDRLFGLNYAQPNQSGKSFPYATRVEDILALAIQLEEEVVKIYTERLQQLDMLAPAHPTTAAYLKVFYEDQLQDSYEDCEHLRRLATPTNHRHVEPRKYGD